MKSNYNVRNFSSFRFAKRRRIETPAISRSLKIIRIETPAISRSLKRIIIETHAISRSLKSKTEIVPDSKSDELFDIVFGVGSTWVFIIMMANLLNHM
jgi:hypothetical protein